MPDDYYARRLDEPSNSSLAQFRRSPLAYRDYVLNGRDKRTPAMSLGTLVHLAVLEPERFRRTALALPSARLNGAASRADWVAQCSEAAGVDLTVDASLPADELRAAVADELAKLGRTVCTDAALEVIRAQVESLKLPTHTLARKLIACGDHEVVIRWTDAASGIRCKGRADILDQARLVLADVKTCEDAGADAFRRALWTYGYHYQEAMYRRGLIASGWREVNAYFVLVEKSPPFHWNVLQIDEEDVARADERISRDLAALRRCLDTDTWPGLIRDEPQTVSMNRRHDQ